MHPLMLIGGALVLLGLLDMSQNSGKKTPVTPRIPAPPEPETSTMSDDSGAESEPALVVDSGDEGDGALE